MEPKTKKNKGALLLAFLLGCVALGGKGSGGGALRPGSRVLLVGDSQSLPHGPGDKLAGKLRAAGYKVVVLAKGGKTAKYFTEGEGLRALTAELLQRPRVVLVFLGSNELANVALVMATLKGQIKGHQALRDLIIKSGARPFFVGPPRFRPNTKSHDKADNEQGEPLETYSDALTSRLEAVYTSKNFLDARPYTPDHAGIHFKSDEAEAFAQALAPAIVERLIK
jgi:lysophospholipase L1-like esterase